MWANGGRTLTGDDFVWAVTRPLHYGSAQQFFEMTSDAVLNARVLGRPARKARNAASIRDAISRRKRREGR